MKKQHFLTFCLTLLLVGFSASGVMAQAPSISGDEVCGATAATKCGVGDIQKIMQGVLALVVSLGLPILVIFVAYRFVTAWFALQQGNANAYKDALKKSGNAILGFFIIIVLFGGGLLIVLKYFGIDSAPLKILELFGSALVPHAYAAAGQYLPNYAGVDNLYDFILQALRLVMRFFIYPALIVMWVWTGFAFVAAQGNPDALNKAKRWLMWAVVTTLVIFLLQAFLVALRGTVQNILPGAKISQ